MVVGHDPQAMANAKEECPALVTSVDPYEAATDAHCLVVCTDWPEFRSLDLERLRGVMAQPFIVDARNLFEPDEIRAAGFSYQPTGRPGSP
jgi:UDPglucose 6-dehydrogenase